MPPFLQLTAESTDGSFSMPFLLQLPAASGEEAEECPITHEPIGSETYVPSLATAASAPVLLLTHPRYAPLLCMELLDCKHRFDARALVAHFMHNGMTCPMCRRGKPDAIFDARATFDETKNLTLSQWVLRHHDEVLHSQKRRRIMASNMLAAILLFDAVEEANNLILDSQQPPQEQEQEQRLELTFTLLSNNDADNDDATATIRITSRHRRLLVLD